MRKILCYTIIIFLCLFFVSCNQNKQNSSNPSQTENIERLNSPSNNQERAEPLAQLAQNILNKQSDTISSYKGLALDKELFIAINVKTFKQASEQKIAKKLQDELKKKLNLSDVNVTSDQKFYMELTKLEEENVTDKKQLKDKLEKFKKLLKEQT